MKLSIIFIIIKIQSKNSETSSQCYCGEIDTNFSDKDKLPNSPRVLGGKLSERGEWPWMALILINPTDDPDYDQDRW